MVVANRETEAQRVGGWIKVPQPLKGRGQTKQKRGPQPGFSDSHIAFIILFLSSTIVLQPEDSFSPGGASCPREYVIWRLRGQCP